MAVSSAVGVTNQKGQTIPIIDESVTTCSDNNVRVCLDGYEATLAEGDPSESISAQGEASIAQETFVPAACELSFSVVARGGSAKNVFGWYHVADAEDGLSAEEHHVFLDCDAPIGETKTLALTGHPAYDGGEIGLFLVNNGYHEEKGYDVCPVTTNRLKNNPDADDITLADWQPFANNNDGARLPQRRFYSQPELNRDTKIQLLTWQSKVDLSSFYFGWEDVSGNAADDDFDDLLTWVSGVQCSGGGAPCTIPGEKGVCGRGTMQCRAGELTCVGGQPGPEKCNALDDDCDGSVDNAVVDCAENEVCDRGRCLARCDSGEFPCGQGLVCADSGACVEASCADVECPPGEVCFGGQCVNGCDGVKCPHGLACRNGACVDPCQSVTCDAGFACEVQYVDEEAVALCSSCDCHGCGGGDLVCSEHLCVEAGCVDMTCAPGTYCEAGTCKPACEGAVCPAGQLCNDETGRCETDPNAEGPGTVTPDGSEGGGPGLVISGPDGGVSDDGSGASSSDGSRTLADGDGSCGCRAVGSGGPAMGAFGAAALALFALGRARFRRRQALHS